MSFFASIKNKMEAAAEERRSRAEEEAKKRAQREETLRSLQARIISGDETSIDELFTFFGEKKENYAMKNCTGLDPNGKYDEDTLVTCLRKCAEAGSSVAKKTLIDGALNGADSYWKSKQISIANGIYFYVGKYYLDYLEPDDPRMAIASYRLGIQYWNDYCDNVQDPQRAASFKQNAYKFMKRAAKLGNEDAEAFIGTHF